ncbi:DUF294 nucleotidyltransferase-like domain-containing protein [Pontibacter beigongshangensis]|uniref:DUF294 nucleotidyltransferase-like domain-containing protein n=1 Tax=Pontibacter beigongshangensis TaxID=2574733 RepID=UPI00164EFF1C|nr:DUF294 nucleotidyltransferase-like domain-containing protein [Pontibacter beigongshangensis]
MQVTNTIQERVHEFLKQYPPFSLVKEEELREIASQVKVMYLEPEQVLFAQGEAAHEHFYVVRQGSVRLELQDPERTGQILLLDVCDEGDVFGVRALIVRKSYSSTAVAGEETLLYAIPSKPFEHILAENPKVELYFAAGFAAGASALRRTMTQTQKARVGLRRGTASVYPQRLEELVKVAADKDLLACLPDTPIQEAAQRMTTKNSSFMLVWDAQQRPIGIVTDTDMRRRVVTGRVGIEEPVHVIMTNPVVTIAPEPAMADALIRMIRHRVKHICVTADGTPQSRAEAVLTEHDLLLTQGNNPAVLVWEIRQTNVENLPAIRERAEELLQKYLEQEVKISFIAGIITEINDAIMVRALQHAEEVLGEPPVPYCWLSIGSEGRAEQLLRTDQDNMLIFEDVPAAGTKAVQAYFLQLAGIVQGILEQCGFYKCRANMMATNPQWCQPLSVWKKYYHSWIQEPTEQALLNASIFFDYRPIYGDFSLSSQLTDCIYEELSRGKIFLPYLARQARQNPTPLSFFRNFILERGGEHKDQFDIKLRAMTPLVDAARVLTLENRITGENNTIKRYEKLAELEPQNAPLYRETAMAYEIMMRLRALNGIRSHNSGRYLKPEQLSKIERQTLRNTFVTITDIQELLQVRFQLGYLRG